MGRSFEVDADIAKQSASIKTMSEDLGINKDEEEAIYLPQC